MVRLSLILVLFFSSCESIKHKTLEDGHTKIPMDKSYFNKNYREKYEIVLPNNIDTNSIYIESFYLDRDGKLFNTKKGFNSYLDGIKFYKNGCLNNFILKKDIEYSIIDLNPAVSGYRGICYKNKNDILMDLIVPVNEDYNLGKKKYYLKVQGDSLFLEDKQTSSKYIYLRVGLKYNNYKPDW